MNIATTNGRSFYTIINGARIETGYPIVPHVIHQADPFYLKIASVLATSTWTASPGVRHAMKTGNRSIAIEYAISAAMDLAGSPTNVPK